MKAPDPESLGNPESLDFAIRDNLLARITEGEREGRLGWGPATDHPA